MSDGIHWNYFFAVEDDLATLSRYVEFHADNFATYSIETAKLLMTAVQEVDVLLKSICTHYAAPSANVRNYHDLMMAKHPNIRDAQVVVSQHALVRRPFAAWSAKTPPLWWTANNNVKHARDTKFSSASLENTIDAISALLVANIYRHAICEGKRHFTLERLPRVFGIRWFVRVIMGGGVRSFGYGIPEK